MSGVRRSWWSLAAESVRVARSNLVVATLVALLAFAAPAISLAVTGLDIEAQRTLLGSLDAIGTRTMSVVATQGADIPAASVDRVARLSGVAWVVGLGPTSDVRDRGGVGGPTPMRQVRQVRAPIDVSAPDTGAWVSAESARRAGLGGAWSVLDPGGLAVSGWFRAREPLQALNAFVLVPRDDGDETGLERLIVSVTDVSQVEAVASAVRDLIGTEAGAGVTIDRSPELLAAREAVQDQVAANDRLLVLVILAATVALAGVVVLFGVLAARRDLGRRRALGATRPQLTVLVVLQTLWPALVGAAMGALVGWGYASLKAGYAIDWQFAAAVGVLTVIALGAAATLPALVAATRDPLRVLRVP